MGAGRARLLEGGPIADEIRTAVAEDVAWFTDANGRPPGLAVVIVGRDAPSTVYLERILRGCAKVGIDAEFVELEGEATEGSVASTIRDLNADPTVDGVIVQMPLPPTIRLRAVVDAIDPAKDIDGIHPMNAGLLRLGYEGFLPATAHAAVEILRRSGIEIEGRDAVVIGRSQVVGMPAAFLLVKEDATVTVCHSRTRDLASHVHRADIVVVAAGRPGLVTCRFTHVYPDGPAPYFSFHALGRPDHLLEPWREIKRRASDALLASGGTITHHHAVGRDHMPWYDQERPDPFAQALRAVKGALDPHGVLNPGVLIDP